MIGRDGRLPRETPGVAERPAAAAAYEELKGKTAFSAREAMVAKLRRVRRPRRRADPDDRG